MGIAPSQIMPRSPSTGALWMPATSSPVNGVQTTTPIAQPTQTTWALGSLASTGFWKSTPAA